MFYLDDVWMVKFLQDARFKFQQVDSTFAQISFHNLINNADLL